MNGPDAGCLHYRKMIIERGILSHVRNDDWSASTKGFCTRRRAVEADKREVLQEVAFKPTLGHDPQLTVVVNDLNIALIRSL